MLSQVAVLYFTPVAHAAITAVNGPTPGTWGSGESFNVVLPSAPKSGDVLICTFGETSPNGFDFVSGIADANGETTWTKEVGNIYQDVAVNYYYDTEIWYGIVNSASASGTITITFVSANVTMYAAEAYVSEYSGMATSDFLDKTASNQGTGFATDSGTTATTTKANELWIASIVASAPQSSPTKGFTLTHYTGTACDLGFLYTVANATGNGNTGTVMGGMYEHDYVSCIATFYAASGVTVTFTDLVLVALVILIVVGAVVGVVVTVATKRRRPRA